MRNSSGRKHKQAVAPASLKLIQQENVCIYPNFGKIYKINKKKLENRIIWIESYNWLQVGLTPPPGHMDGSNRPISCYFKKKYAPSSQNARESGAIFHRWMTDMRYWLNLIRGHQKVKSPQVSSFMTRKRNRLSTQQNKAGMSKITDRIPSTAEI